MSTLVNKNQLGDGVFTEDSLMPGQGVKFSGANYFIYGSPTITDGVASGFSNSNYLTFANPLKEASLTSFEFVTAINTSTVGYSQSIIDPIGGSFSLRVELNSSNKVFVRISTGGTASYVQMTGTTTIAAGTKYWVKVTYSSSAGYDLYTSTDGETWTTEVHGYSTQRPYQYVDSCYIGRNVTDGYYFRGSIYLEDTYFNVNGNRVWTAAGSTFVNLAETPLVNSNTFNTGGLTILGTSPSSTNATNSVNIGPSSSVSGTYATAVGNASVSASDGVAIGQNARATQAYSQAIGMNSRTGSSYATAIGYNAQANGQFSIQIGPGTNSTTQTMNVALSTSSSGNYQLLDASGEIPVARLKAMTGASSSTAGAKGAVPAPAAGDEEKFLKGDGTWAGAADTSLSNITDSGKILSSFWAMPSTTASAFLVVISSGVLLTAPSNGYVWVHAVSTGTNLISIEPEDSNGNVTMKMTSYTPAANTELNTICPVYKGQNFRVHYNTGIPTVTFVYANGSQSEYVNSGGGTN